MLRIGELANHSHISPDTLRYYERLGLLRPPPRTDSGYRLYTEEDVRRLQFIRRAKLLGLSLEEIRSLVGLAEEGECSPLREHVVGMLRRKIDELDGKLAELTALRGDLQEHYRRALDRENEPSCACADFPESCACLPLPIEALRPGARATALAAPEINSGR